MRQSLTAVLERNTTIEDSFETEPYEVAWATEARWFVQVLSAGDDSHVEIRTQVSPDGLTWCDYDGNVQVTEGLGLTSWPVREFGHWLRVRGQVRSGGPAKIRVYLAVKS